jgi:hypothetical protein
MHMHTNMPTVLSFSRQESSILVMQLGPSSLVVDLVRVFQSFSASDVSCILCEPFVVKASQPMR